MPACLCVYLSSKRTPSILLLTQTYSKMTAVKVQNAHLKRETETKEVLSWLQ